ncbi:hypothetical protein D6D27_05857 [Aureobasidium pullulans]|nr:hypothetical protein D6D27_05857 [Aureobasidium pullulans]
MAQSPSALSDPAASATQRNIFGRPAQYSWMQPSTVLSQPPLRASGKHAQRQAAAPVAIDCETVPYESPSTVPLQSSPLQELGHVHEAAVLDASNRRNFLPSPAPSDHYDKSPSLPAVRQSPAQPVARLRENRHASATSSRQASISTPALPQSSAANSPTITAQSATSNSPLPNTALPFGPQWSAVFQSDECAKRLSDFAAAHEHLNEADLERLGILYDATIQNDWYFIILLMLLACHSIKSQALQPLLTQLPQHALPLFARLLGEQWENGCPLSRDVLLFISTYPRPLNELRVSLTEQSFMTAIRHIADCLYSITLNLDRVLSKCRQAETLPTVHDLIESLGIRSLLFQRATFRFLLRNTWGSDSGPSAELAMREFMIEQQRFGLEGGQSPEVRGFQQNIYRNIYHQHVCAAQHLHSNPITSVNSNPATATSPVQRSAMAPIMPPLYNMAQLQSPHLGQAPNQPQTQTAAQLQAQMRIQMQIQAQVQAQAQAQAQAHAHAHAHAAQAQLQPQAAQSPLPALFQNSNQAQNQNQGASLPPSTYFQNPGGSFQFQPGFQQGASAFARHPGQPGHHNNPATPQDIAQMQSLMLYQQQMRPVLSSNSPSSATQRSRPQPAQSRPPPRLFFPGPNVSVPQPAQPDYRRSALHQAHMRSPVLAPKLPDTSVCAASNDHFRRVVGFALEPVKLTTSPVQEIPFQLPPQAVEKLLSVKAGVDGDPPYGEPDTTSIMLRLRCCEVIPTRPLPTENGWVTLDGSWPVQAYFTVNQTPLEPRRKLHHGKCLPIDVTHCVRADANKLVVRINRSRHDKSPFNYAVAIEVVGFATRESITQACMKRLVPSERILSTIKKAMTSDDEDLIMQPQCFSIHLFEPFSNAKIFDIPVRGQDCLHREAFDLGVFLDTRLERPTQPPKDRISKVDVWRCPICKADSRPQSLIVDGFLVTVRQELASKNLLKTRSINIESDGSWSPVREAQDDEETEDEATPAPKKPVEVILIDDD